MAPAAQILWPRPSLGGCVFAAVVRDTRGRALSHADRYNHFPAGPFCSVTAVFSGVCHLLAERRPSANPASASAMPSLAVTGPQRGPTVSWNPGELHAATVIFYPDAFVALTGIGPAALLDRTANAEETLPRALLDIFYAFHRSALAEPIHRGFRVFEDGLELLWHHRRPKGHAVSAWLHDWGRAVGAKAALSGTGRSARQIGRRIKALTGLTARDLDGFGQSEQLYARLGDGNRDGGVGWAKLAADAGYADQSHMARRVRRDTGLAPAQLLRAARTDEAFWCYRLLGERY